MNINPPHHFCPNCNGSITVKEIKRQSKEMKKGEKAMLKMPAAQIPFLTFSLETHGEHRGNFRGISCRVCYRLINDGHSAGCPVSKL